MIGELVILGWIFGLLIGMPIGSIINEIGRKPKRDERGRFRK